MDSRLLVALPTGRLFRAAEPLLLEAGIPLPPPGRRDRSLRVEGPGAVALFVKDRDVPVYVEHGAADLGVVGRDVLEEQPARLYAPLDLGVGSCRMVLARPGDRPLPPPPFRIATKYPEAAGRHFLGRGIAVDLIRLSGAVEIAPALDLADGIVDLVETGGTLAANGLVEEETLFESTARVVVNRASFRLRRPLVQPALRRLAAAASPSGAAAVPSPPETPIETPMEAPPVLRAETGRAAAPVAR